MPLWLIYHPPIHLHNLRPAHLLRRHPLHPDTPRKHLHRRRRPRRLRPALHPPRAADHIAHNFPRDDDDKAIRDAGNTIGDVLAPERETEGERLWIEGNRPVPYE